MLRTLGLVPAFLLLLVGSAQARPTVAVVGVHGDGDTDEQTLRALHGELAEGFTVAQRFAVLDPDALASRFLPARAQLLSSVFLGPADAALQEGRIHYEGARFEQAIEALRRAEAALAGNLEFVTDQRLLVDTHLYLGLSYASIGARDDAREAFGEVVRLAPDRVLDTLEYPPKIVSVFDEARQAVLSRGGGALQIEAPEGARVFVDGRRVGEGSVRVSDLPPGFHGVLAQEDGVGRAFTELTLGAGDERAVSLELTPRGLARQDDPWQPARSGVTRRLAEEVARVAGSDLVVLAALDPDGNLQLALYSARSDTFGTTLSASLDAAPAARDAFVVQLVEKLAEQVDGSGAIASASVSVELPTLRIGTNPVLNDLLFGAPPAAAPPPAVATADEPAPTVRRERKPVNPGAVVGVILGILGAGGAATGVYFAVRPTPPPVGTLTITIP